MKNRSGLIDYLVKDSSCSIRVTLESWMTTCVRFEGFAQVYRDKIRKKISEASSEDVLGDILFELEVAYLLCQNERFGLEYEKGKSTTDRTPDFVLSFDHAIDIGIEVKRIRETFVSIRYNALIQDIVDEIQKIPSSLGFSLICDDLDANPKIVDKLESEKEAIIRHIANAIKNEENRIGLGAALEHPLPGIDGKFVLLLTKPLRKMNADETSYNGGFRPSLYTQREHLKFSDAILAKMRQMLPSVANVLVITSDSTTHEAEDLYQAIHFLIRCINKKDDAFFINKGFLNAADFLAYWKRLSGIVFRSIWINISNRGDRNILWHNEYAEYQIPESVAAYFKKMDKARVTV